MVAKIKKQIEQEILDAVVDALLDENVDVKIETTYRKDLRDKNGSVYASELTTKPGIPTEYGKINRTGGMSDNAYRARSVKIGKISITKLASGLRFRMPDGTEASYASSADYNQDAFCSFGKE